MTWLFDQPAWIIVAGVVLAALFGMLWANTGRNYWLILLGGAVVLTIILLITERFVETDREALQRVVHEIAADVEKNDRTQLFKYIHSEATSLQQKANSELPNYNFEECTITKIYSPIEVTGDDKPRKAVVRFMVRAKGNFQLGSDSLGGQFYRFVTLFFKQEPDGTWKVTDYAHDDPTQAIRKEDGATLPH